VQQRSVFFFLQLSSNQIANRQANLPQLQLHQIVIAPAAPVNFIKASKRTKHNSNTVAINFRLRKCCLQPVVHDRAVEIEPLPGQRVRYSAFITWPSNGNGP